MSAQVNKVFTWGCALDRAGKSEAAQGTSQFVGTQGPPTPPAAYPAYPAFPAYMPAASNMPAVHAAALHAQTEGQSRKRNAEQANLRNQVHQDDQNAEFTNFLRSYS